MDKHTRGGASRLMWCPFPRPPGRSPTTIPCSELPFHSKMLSCSSPMQSYTASPTVNCLWWKYLQKENGVRGCRRLSGRLVSIISEATEIKGQPHETTRPTRSVWSTSRYILIMETLRLVWPLKQVYAQHLKANAQKTEPLFSLPLKGSCCEKRYRNG